MPKIIRPVPCAHLDEEDQRGSRRSGRSRRRTASWFFFTDHDRDIVFDGDSYQADPATKRTAIRAMPGSRSTTSISSVFAEEHRGG